MSAPQKAKKWWHSLEENLLALILMLMMALTFINVILRSWFNSAILWGLEATSYLFAWLVLLGLGYLVRTHSHLGVDVVVNLLGMSKRRLLGLFIAIICIVYSALLLKGAYDFSANYYNLPTTESSIEGGLGEVIPTGFQEMKLRNYKGYTPVFDTPMPNWLRPIWQPVFLIEGDDPYRKLPINIPYAALFLGVLWMFIRFIFAFGEIWRGAMDRLIASHEAEEAVEDVKLEEGA